MNVGRKTDGFVGRGREALQLEIPGVELGTQDGH